MAKKIFSYHKTCTECHDKDEVIQELRDEVQTLKLQIKNLKFSKQGKLLISDCMGMN